MYTTTLTGKQTTLELLGRGTVLWARRLEALQAHAVHAQAVTPTSAAFINREELDRFVLKKTRRWA